MIKKKTFMLNSEVKMIIISAFEWKLKENEKNMKTFYIFIMLQIGDNCDININKQSKEVSPVKTSGHLYGVDLYLTPNQF